MTTRQTVPEVWVSPSGDNKAIGTKQRPVKTLPVALSLLRRQRREAGPGTPGRILLSNGTHVLKKPLILDHRDSGCAGRPSHDIEERRDRPVIIQSAPGARATLSGGRRITGWQETTVNGVNAWTTTLKAVKTGKWTFTQLWVNGQRAQRPRLPETGTFTIAKRFSSAATRSIAEEHGIHNPEDCFGYAEGDLWRFKNLTDVDFVGLHFWIESRIPIAALDETSRRVDLAFPTRIQLTDCHDGGPAPYYVDNVFEALRKPGQWYLDRPSGQLTYIPRPGENMETAEIIAPVLDHLVSLVGDPEHHRYVEQIEFRDLTFAHSEQILARNEYPLPQAAATVQGGLRFIHARSCHLRRCTVEHIGSYGVDINGDSTDCQLRHCTIRDTSGGGVRIFHRSPPARAGKTPPAKDSAHIYRPGRIIVADCHIHDGGHRWRQAVGVLIGNASGIEVSHCHIHDFDYTGISVGWTWGYGDSHTFGNVIEWNHIHDIGRGVLSDMGGIYLLGQQPGTRVRYNHIHHVDSRNYGGWGIYPDQGASNLLIENNLVHDTKCDPFSQHFARDNVVRNNIFAFAREAGMVGLSRVEPYTAFTFERNIVVTDGLQITRKPYNEEVGYPLPCCRFDHNLYFDIKDKRLTFNGLSWSAWRKTGQDSHSLNMNPGFMNPAKRDFRLRTKKSVDRIGFIPFDLTDVGPRKETHETDRD